MGAPIAKFWREHGKTMLNTLYGKRSLYMEMVDDFGASSADGVYDSFVPLVKMCEKVILGAPCEEEVEAWVHAVSQDLWALTAWWDAFIVTHQIGNDEGSFTWDTLNENGKRILCAHQSYMSGVFRWSKRVRPQVSNVSVYDGTPIGVPISRGDKPGLKDKVGRIRKPCKEGQQKKGRGRPKNVDSGENISGIFFTAVKLWDAVRPKWDVYVNHWKKKSYEDVLQDGDGDFKAFEFMESRTKRKVHPEDFIGDAYLSNTRKVLVNAFMHLFTHR